MFNHTILGSHKGCHYGNDSMNVIRHNDEFLQSDILESNFQSNHIIHKSIDDQFVFRIRGHWLAWQNYMDLDFGGEGGIRTHGTAIYGTIA